MPRKAILFGRLKDWQRVVIRYFKRPKTFLFATAFVALFSYWLLVLSLAHQMP